MKTSTKPEFEVQGNWHYTMVDNAIFEDERITTTDQSVYMALCSFMSIKSHECFPSYETLMKRAHVGGRNTLSRAIKRLESYGFIKVEHPSGRCNVYTVWAREDQYHNGTTQYNNDTPQCHNGTLTKAIELKPKNKTCRPPSGEGADAPSPYLKDLSKEQREAVFRLPEAMRVKTALRMRDA